MDVVTAFINLLLIPILPVAVGCRRRGEALKLSGRTLTAYSAYTVCNMILVHLIMVITGSVIGIAMTPNSSLYAVVALPVAYILPYIAEIARTWFRVRCEIKPKESEKIDG